MCIVIIISIRAGQWQTHRLTEHQTNWITYWLTDLMIEWTKYEWCWSVSDCTIDPLTDWLTDWLVQSSTDEAMKTNH